MFHGEINPGNESLGRPDYYLSHPPKQPKKEIGDYVESCGILVPKRFATLSDALSSGKPTLARSEHPQDYAGVSDLFPSYRIDQKTFDSAKNLNGREVQDDTRGDGSLSNSEIFFKLITRVRSISQEEFEANLGILETDRVLQYCSLMSISVPEFLVQASFSYWELLPGFNRTIVADNSIPGRYHVITKIFEGGGYGYTIVENGVVTEDFSWKLPEALYSSLPLLVELYESIRRLGKFDRNHCPIIETQTVGEIPYFLQYHRGTNLEPSTFVLDREQEEGEIQASYVRGTTPKDGVILRLNVHTMYDKTREVKNEDAGLDWQGAMYRQIMARKRRLQLKDAGGFGNISQFLALAPHLTVSELFKSPLCLSIRKGEERDKFLREFYGSKEKPVNQFNIRVVSDGRRAYIKRLD